MDKEVVVGYITNYIYSVPDSLYKVCVLTTLDKEEITIIGNFPKLEDGLIYEFVGVRKVHIKYGEQFFVESYAKSNSFTKEGLIHYLSGEKFYGIGEKTAENIVEVLGLDCIHIILNDPKRLDEVKGLTLSKKEMLERVLKENYDSEQVFIRLYGFGLTPKMVQRLYDVYGVQAANKIEENPYCLIEEVEGFGFKKCDALALNMGFKREDPLRIRSAILYTVSAVCYQQGFTFLTMEQTIHSVLNLLGDSEISSLNIENEISYLRDSGKLKVEEDRIFESNLYFFETKCAEKLLKLSKGGKENFKKERLKESLKDIEKLLNITYTPQQKEAILEALANKLSIITGGPGTGKSTILNGILTLYAKMHNASLSDDVMQYKILLVAPTGRAAKRMSEATHFKASTIHKALGYSYDGGFEHNEMAPLSCGLAIIDEASMLDIEMAYRFFTALPNSCQVILVGDVHQLPSVSPGNVLFDLIQSDIFKTTELTQIMRQAENSDIVSLSYMILAERIYYPIFNNKKEVFFYNYDTKDVIKGIFRIFDNFIESGGDLLTDIQILVPMYAGVAGIDAINSAIQAKYNPETEKIIKRENLLFKKNDKVLQLKNDSELDIMNGDIGKIIDVIQFKDKEMLCIDFYGRIVQYPISSIENLKLAYAISIHKSQGSEFKNVILPILPSYQIMLKKKILYTAITRAKEKLILLGKPEVLERAIHTVEYGRQTTLYSRVQQKQNEEEKIFDESIPFDTFGEYDMEDITPYSFMD